MGEDRQDRPGHSSGQRASVREAAELLGTTVDAIRKRVQRDTIPHEKASDGRVWILLDAVQDSTGHGQDTGRSQSDSSTLIPEMVEELRDEVHYLREQLHQELERRSAEAERYQQIVAALTTANASLSERLRVLEPPQEAPSEARESPETVEEAPEEAEPRPAAGEAQEGVQKPWWPIIALVIVVLVLAVLLIALPQLMGP